MKEKVKIFTIFVVILSMTGCFAGCGSGETANNPGSRAIKEKINIEDIAWNVDEGIVGGERYVLLSYTNDTQYTITNFEITFNEKAGITEEEKSDFYSDIQKKFELSDEDMDDLKSRSISMRAETDRVVKPGESISNVNCYYYGGSFYLKDINHYNLVEPDIATIKYLEEDKIFTVYYDYGSKKYSTEEKTEIAYQWSQTDLGSKIPKPDVKVVKSSIDDKTSFMFDAYGLTLEQFNAYVDECKELGYTDESNNYEGSYTADNAEGYNVHLYYDERDHSMSVTISAPKTESE